MIAALLGLCPVSIAAGKDPEVPLTAQGEKLLATYTGMLDTLRAEIAAAAPVIDEWERTRPVGITLREGRNSPQFTVRPPNKELTIKEITLTPVAE